MSTDNRIKREKVRDEDGDKLQKLLLSGVTAGTNCHTHTFFSEYLSSRQQTPISLKQYADALSTKLSLRQRRDDEDGDIL